MPRSPVATIDANGGLHHDEKIFTIEEITQHFDTVGAVAGKPLPDYKFDMSEGTGLRGAAFPELAEIAEMLVESVASQEKSRIELAQTYTLPGDVDRVRSYAHRMHGVASNLRQTELMMALRPLERACKDLAQSDRAERLADPTVQEELAHLLDIGNARMMTIVAWFEKHGTGTKGS